MGNLSISDYGSLFANYRIPSIPEVKVDQVQPKQSEQAQIQAQSKTVINEQEAFENTASKSADLENLSLKFNSGEDYGYIGKDKELADLDIQKAISDMKKDSVLQQYQYFVGSTQNVMSGNTFASEDGIVIPKFDF